jgi:UDP-N-acetylmuramoyl-tripeptide--D-alanyl-D-alanine ligase
MNRLKVNEILDATKGQLISGDPGNYITGVKHDSRECGEGDMFVAIVGDNLNGHNYVPQVLESGCTTIMVSEDGNWLDAALEAGANIIRVDDTVYALGELASYYLDTLNVKKVAVTGSVGKTSVRDMIYYVLCEKYNCGRNMKNFNNFIGVPLSIFQFDSSTEAVVLEMGMDKRGEIDRLAEIIKPNIAVITNIGMAHIENLGSRHGIFEAKMEVAGHLATCNDGDGTLVFADDGDMLTRETTKGDYKQVTIGYNGKSDYIISAVDEQGLKGIQFSLEHLQESSNIFVPVPGKHNAVNGSLAIAVGNLLGVTVEEACRGLSKVRLTGSRLKRIDGDKVCVIDDTYNANPDSMKSALKILESSNEGARKVAVLGDMFELGSESSRQHFGVGVFARGLDIDLLIAIGDEATRIYEGATGGQFPTAHFNTKEEFFEVINQYIQDGDLVLVKGSRGMRMERVVNKLLEQ